MALLHMNLALAAFQPPNILFILADDLGVGDVSVYPSPLVNRSRLNTPNLDKLAMEGIRFDAAYAGYSVCAPSRMTLMTGRHVGHVHSIGMPKPASNATTVATMLKSAGYETFLLGKWGLDGNYKTPQPPTEGFPTKQGFDYFYGQSDQWQCHDYYPPFMFNGTRNVTIETNTLASVNKCGGPDHEKCTWSADLWTSDAVRIIRGRRKKPTAAQPFFMYLAYTSPHAGSVGSVAETDVPGPRVLESEYAEHLNNTVTLVDNAVEVWPAVEVHFANTVTLVDNAVGTVLAALDEDAEQKRNTVVFFASDNGAHEEGGHLHEFFQSSAYLRGFKRSIHDGGHRSPLLVRWPGGGVAPASVTQQQWCFYDFMLTAAELAGVAYPSPALPAALKLDGYSVVATLKGGDGAQPQPPFLYHDFDSPNDCVAARSNPAVSCEFGQSVRMGNWSTVCVCKNLGTGCTGVAPTSECWLYDLGSDPGQETNEAKAHPEIVSAALVIMQRELNRNWPGPPQPTPPPTPPPTPGPPINLTMLSGIWIQSQGGQQSPMAVTVDTAALTISIKSTSSCCAWSTAKGTVSMSSEDGNHTITITIVATGNDGKFTTGEVGVVSSVASSYRANSLYITWTPTSGQKKHWGGWSKANTHESAAAPLLRTSWGQRWSFAQFAPLARASSASGLHERLGCCSTALAQVMYFHRACPTGSVKYTTAGYAATSMDFDAAAKSEGLCTWSEFGAARTPPNSSVAPSTAAIARYSYASALIVEKEWGTGSYEYKRHVDRAHAASQHFLLPIVIHNVTDNATLAEALVVIATEIAAKRPLIMMISSFPSLTTGLRHDHWIVIDGYEASNSSVHLVFGHSGFDDGWFSFGDAICLKHFQNGTLPSGVGGTCAFNYNDVLKKEIWAVGGQATEDGNSLVPLGGGQ